MLPEDQEFWDDLVEFLESFDPKDPPVYLGMPDLGEMDRVVTEQLYDIQHTTYAMLSFESRTARNWQYSISEMDRLLQDS